MMVHNTFNTSYSCGGQGGSVLVAVVVIGGGEGVSYGLLATRKLLHLWLSQVSESKEAALDKASLEEC